MTKPLKYNHFLQSIIFTPQKCHSKVCVSFCTDCTEVYKILTKYAMQFKSYEHFHQKGSTSQKCCSVKPRHRFSYQRLDNVIIHQCTKFEPNISCGSRVMSIFTKRARPAKMMLGEASSHFYTSGWTILKYISIQNLNQIYDPVQAL